jgi:hypothetical protein
MKDPTKPVTKYDKKGNILYLNTGHGFEEKHEYNPQGRETYYWNSTGFECWKVYDPKGLELKFVNIKKPGDSRVEM